MEVDDQGEVEGSSPAYAFPQSNFSDTKAHEEHSASQLSATGIDEKTRFTLVDRTKPVLPGYSGRAKAEKDAKTLAVRSRGVVSHAKAPTSIAKKVQPVPQRSVEPLIQVVSHPLVLTAKEPTADDRYAFFVRIKLDEKLQDQLEDGVYDPSKPFLTQSIATGDWLGIICTIEAREDSPEDVTQILVDHDKTTWGVFLEKLYALNPTGSFRDLGPKGKILYPNEDWYYYDVNVSLTMGARVE